MISVLDIRSTREAERLMRQIKVDEYGIRIMAPKAVTRVVRIDGVPNFAANILKQEMLSLGGDVAVARDALTGRGKKSSCVLIGNLSQLARLNEKLLIQPFGLADISRRLQKVLDGYAADGLVIEAAGCLIRTAGRTLIMGIINNTPDSFSGDGLLTRTFAEAVAKAREMVAEGADMIDVGGESSRPQAKPVPLKEEIRRTIPLIKALKRAIKVPISIDTCKPEVARQALDNGAAIVNDITALRDKRMRKVVMRYRAAAVLMHMKGTPRTMQQAPVYEDVVLEVKEFLHNALLRAEEDGIKRSSLFIDPGIGFGKTVEHNLQILRRLREFRSLGRPILVGTSRKSFIGRIARAEVSERVFGTAASCVLAAENGAHIVRVHDVRQVRQALDIADSIRKA